jgi:hypothetical protein
VPTGTDNKSATSANVNNFSATELTFLKEIVVCFALPDFGRDGVGHLCPVKGTSCHFVIRFAHP